MDQGALDTLMGNLLKATTFLLKIRTAITGLCRVGAAVLGLIVR
jgi:hypothetical protein